MPTPPIPKLEWGEDSGPQCSMQNSGQVLLCVWVCVYVCVRSRLCVRWRAERKSAFNWRNSFLISFSPKHPAGCGELQEQNFVTDSEPQCFLQCVLYCHSDINLPFQYHDGIMRSLITFSSAATPEAAAVRLLFCSISIFTDVLFSHHDSVGSGPSLFTMTENASGLRSLWLFKSDEMILIQGLS